MNVYSTGRQLHEWNSIPACVSCGDPRVFSQVSKRPQVPAKDAWPCATTSAIEFVEA
jgi:hypothetical protein